MFRAAAAKLWHAGVDAIHVFNYDCHCTGIQHHAVEEHIGLDDVPLFNPDEYRILTEIGDREGIARKDKHYVVAHDVDRRSGGADEPLPVDLAEPGQAAEIDLIVADDLDGARSEGALAAWSSGSPWTATGREATGCAWSSTTGRWHARRAASSSVVVTCRPARAATGCGSRWTCGPEGLTRRCGSTAWSS